MSSTIVIICDFIRQGDVQGLENHLQEHKIDLDEQCVKVFKLPNRIEQCYDREWGDYERQFLVYQFEVDDKIIEADMSYPFHFPGHDFTWSPLCYALRIDTTPEMYTFLFKNTKNLDKNSGEMTFDEFLKKNATSKIGAVIIQALMNPPPSNSLIVFKKTVVSPKNQNFGKIAKLTGSKGQGYVLAAQYDGSVVYTDESFDQVVNIVEGTVNTFLQYGDDKIITNGYGPGMYQMSIPPVSNEFLFAVESNSISSICILGDTLFAFHGYVSYGGITGTMYALKTQETTQIDAGVHDPHALKVHEKLMVVAGVDKIGMLDHHGKQVGKPIQYSKDVRESATVCDVCLFQNKFVLVSHNECDYISLFKVENDTLEYLDPVQIRCSDPDLKICMKLANYYDKYVLISVATHFKLFELQNDNLKLVDETWKQIGSRTSFEFVGFLTPTTMIAAVDEFIHIFDVKIE